MWLAADLIEQTPNLDQLIAILPDPLQESFRQQLQVFGPSVPFLPDALKRLVAGYGNGSKDFDAAAGRLLHASAAIIPNEVADVIAQVLNRTSADSPSLPRRELVMALSILLWHSDLWDQVVDALFELARSETEAFANNATGIFVNCFAIYLSGTTVPFEQRSRWLDEAIDRAASSDVELLANASSAAFASFASRVSAGSFRGVLEPRDWEPGSQEEIRLGRLQAWHQLMKLVNGSEGERTSLVASVARSLRMAIASGLSAEVDSDLRAVDWSPEERAILASELRRDLEHDSRMAEMTRQQVGALLVYLMGDGVDARLATVLNTPYWELERPGDDWRAAPTAFDELLAGSAFPGEVVRGVEKVMRARGRNRKRGAVPRGPGEAGDPGGGGHRGPR